MQKAIAETRWTLFFITGVIALLTVLVSYGFATLFVRPVRELQQGAEKIRTGDLSQRLPIHSSDEMGELAHSFNQMAETLEEKTLGLEHRNQELARLVEELKATQHQLLQAEKMAAMGQLVSGIAHELNNPLAGVIGSAELLLTQPRNDENTSEGLRRIYREATRAAKIVRNLLTFARQHKPKKQSIQINKVIEETLELRAYELKTHNIQVITALAEVLPKTVADFYQIQQVLLNLINNAEQAMLEAHGRGVLTLKTRLLQQSRSSTPALVSRLALDPGNVDQQNAGASIEISISDDGPGIPPENLQRIFEPFFTTKEVGKGTGLGLSICYSIIQEHGGRIYATSQVGKGATFIIELPVHTGTGVSEDVHGLEISENRVQIRKQILLVDDEETIGEMVEEVLQQCGYSVDQARNGLEAIKKIQHKDYDLIISDLYMPAMGGQELYRWIKEHHTPLTQRMLFITGDLISQRNQAFLAETGNRYLGKPFSMKEFTRIVQEVLGEG
jgi:two-component system NtrC family sensor kinase